jgi:phage-related minor tail protein
MKRIGDLSVRVSLDATNINQSTQQINRNLKTLGGEMSIIRNKGNEWGKSLEGLSEKQRVLTNTLGLHEIKVQKAAEKHKELVKEHGEGSVQAEKQAAALNRLIAKYTKTESELAGVNNALNKHQREMDEAGKSYVSLERLADKLGDKLQDVGSKMKDTGQNLSTGVTLPLVGFATAAGKVALDFDKSAGSIQSELGVSKKRAEELHSTAKELWEDGFGESLQDVSRNIAGVTKSLGDISKVDLSYVTKGLDLFESKGWGDQQETLRSLKVLMEQFGMSASEAMDYLTKGFQENLNFSGEFLDSISEYSTYYAEVGLSADDMFAKFKSGAESGVFQMDKIGDSMKEFTLRSKDGSKTSTEAFKALGLNAKEMTTQFNKGGETGKKAFEKVVKALQDTDDETVRNTVATGLFGTQYEDLGEKAFDAMLTTTDGLKDVEGATKKASDSFRDNFGTRATKIWRDFQEDLEPVGETLLDIAEDVLPKVADTVGDVTDAFNDMSPEGQKVVIAVGGIAAAAGPAMVALGFMSQGLGTVTKLATPLLSTLGKGAGLTGVLTKIPGPIGLVAGGLALATTAFIGIKEATEKAKEVNLEHAETLIKQKDSLEGLASKYDVLRDKNQLSNDELLRFRDIQSELDLATSAEEINKLTKEADGLREKSGLSNDEMNEMLKLNDDIIKLTPDVKKSFSDRGQAIIESKGAIDDVNVALAESIRLELENQRIKNEANMDENIRNYIDALDELNEKEQKRNEAVKLRDEIEQNIFDLKIKKQKEINEGKDRAATATELEIERQEAVLSGQNQQVSKLSDKVTKQQESVSEAQKEIDKTIELYDQMINLQLAQVGINDEGSKGISQLDKSIAKTQGKINTLLLVKEAQGGLNAKQQEELDNLSKALGQYQDAKGEIVDMQGEQAEVNKRIDEGTGKAKKLTDEAGKGVTKEVDIDDKGGTNKLQKEAEKGAHKNVKIDDNGGNNKIQKDAEKKANKGVKLSLLNTLASLIPSSVSVGVKLLGKIPGFATGTRNAPEGMALVGENGPELIHLNKGAKVIPNPQTEAILRDWNIPMLAEGGVTLTSGMAYVGEKGKELIDYRGAKTSPLSNDSIDKIGQGTYYGNVYVTIPAKDVQELNGVVDFFKRLPQQARKNGEKLPNYMQVKI